jgi:iron complex outermembrane receptor protein
LEARAQVTPELSANLSLGLADAKFDRTPVLTANNILVFQNTPKWNGSFQLVYNVPGSIFGGRVSVNGAASYRSFTYQFSAPIPPLDQKAYALVDANISWTSASGAWQAIGSARNLLDERYKVAGYNFPGLTFGNTLAAFYGDPQTFHISMQYKF